jgi:uncharacterized membrane protein
MNLHSIKKAVNLLSILFIGVGFLGVGMLKVNAYPSVVTQFKAWQFPLWSMYTIGILEMVFALSLLTKWRKFGTYALIGLMIGAISTHLMYNEIDQLYGPIIVIGLCFTLLWSESK